MCVQLQLATYYWRELTQVSFLSRQNTSFVATNVCLSRQNYVCLDKCIVAIKVCLPRQTYVCHDKIIFVSIHILSRKHLFVATKMILIAVPAYDSYLHFGQNDWGLLHAAEVTRGWNRYRSKSQHRKLTPEEKSLRPLLPWFEPETFQLRVLSCATELPQPPAQLLQ